MLDHGKVPGTEDGFTIHVCQLRPESRGEIGLRSSNPFDDPAIRANYLSSEEDKRALREGVRMTQDLAGQAALKPIIGSVVSPDRSIATDAELDAWIRQTAETIYHPVGTCRMGVAGDRLAVVDETLKVFGIEGLRVIDASVMPTLVGGNTNAPTIMIAEKAADLILGRAAPKSEEAAVYADAHAA
jgi:choline dehydrogenase